MRCCWAEVQRRGESGAGEESQESEAVGRTTDGLAIAHGDVCVGVLSAVRRLDAQLEVPFRPHGVAATADRLSGASDLRWMGTAAAPSAAASAPARSHSQPWNRSLVRLPALKHRGGRFCMEETRHRPAYLVHRPRKSYRRAFLHVYQTATAEACHRTWTVGGAVPSSCPIRRWNHRVLHLQISRVSSCGAWIRMLPRHFALRSLVPLEQPQKAKKHLIGIRQLQ